MSIVFGLAGAFLILAGVSFGVLAWRVARSRPHDYAAAHDAGRHGRPVTDDMVGAIVRKR